jgi:hypothetical protein
MKEPVTIHGLSASDLRYITEDMQPDDRVSIVTDNERVINAAHETLGSTEIPETGNEPVLSRYGRTREMTDTEMDWEMAKPVMGWPTRKTVENPPGGSERNHEPT